MLDQVLSLYDYKNVRVSELIIAGKYKFIPDAFSEVAPGLSRLVTQYTDLDNTQTLITPLPLHRYRQRWRGFNQAAILARRMATDLKVPYAEVLLRHRQTKTQKDLQKADRLTNVANCFSLATQADVHKKTVLLVDDVTTSGSTLSEAAKILKQHGTSQVIGITLARD
ncbi:MAG: ComF family protein [Candidatus Doudnabacteria bacterium]|nr:ComF family protein [Candidatus Doudnabacteria bacterium]